MKQKLQLIINQNDSEKTINIYPQRLVEFFDILRFKDNIILKVDRVGNVEKVNYEDLVEEDLSIEEVEKVRELLKEEAKKYAIINKDTFIKGASKDLTIIENTLLEGVKEVELSSGTIVINNKYRIDTKLDDFEEVYHKLKNIEGNRKEEENRNIEKLKKSELEILKEKVGIKEEELRRKDILCKEAIKELKEEINKKEEEYNELKDNIIKEHSEMEKEKYQLNITINRLEEEIKDLNKNLEDNEGKLKKQTKSKIGYIILLITTISLVFVYEGSKEENGLIKYMETIKQKTIEKKIEANQKETNSSITK